MKVLHTALAFLRRTDLLLLALCLLASLFGVVIIASATNHFGSMHYVLVQLIAILLGVIFYILLSQLDIDILADRSELLFVFNLLFIGMLFIWGIEGNTGNRSWLSFSFLPFNIQPAEICKATYVIICAKLMQTYRRRLSEPKAVAIMTGHMLITVAAIFLASKDTGVALIYVFVFLLMAYAGGVSRYWFLTGGILALIGAPFLWFIVFRDSQRNRIISLFNPSIDAAGVGVRWQTNLSLRAIKNGGVAGQGLFHGGLTQAGANPQQHNDFIFSTIAEELGIVGCLIVVLLIAAIIFRCIQIGMRSKNYMNRMICIGIGGTLIFQTVVNVGMCLGLLPVVGLTLPFISYGGSSILSLYASVGLVSGIAKRPDDTAEAIYIRPPYPQ